MAFRAAAVTTALAALRLASCQLTQTVSVGTFYSPPLIAAPGINDTIVFLFMSGVHGVTQSSLEKPCEQLEGGFNSGLIKGNTDRPPSWNLTVTNISAPIWYMCQALQPFSHCNNGMVGAINAPLDQFSNFTGVAKTHSNTPPIVTDMVATGQGALATAPPLIPAITSSAGTTTTAPTSSSTPQPTSKSSSNKGAIIGGAAGGAAVLIIIAVLLFLLCKARNKNRPQRAEPFNIEDTHKFDESKNGVYAASQLHTGGNDGNMFAPTPMRMNSPPLANAGIISYQNQSNQNHVGGANRGGSYAGSEPASDINDRDRDTVPAMPSPNAGQQQFHHNDPRYSTYSDARTMSDYASSSTMPQSQRRTDSNYQGLAKEVADLLLPQLRAGTAQSPPPNQGPAEGNSHQSLQPPEFRHELSKSPPPPEYSHQ